MVNFRKRYRRLLFLSCVVFGIYSCNNHQSFKESEHFLIPDETSTSDIRGDVEFLSLIWPEDVMMSHITDIKVYGDFIFIHDRDGTMTITVFDTQGNFIDQLNRVGRGPGEYLDIEAFAFDIENENLVIYSRTSKEFHIYTFPGLDFLQTLQKGKYVINFEIFDEDNWVVICDEESENKYHGIERWDAHLADRPVGKEVSRFPISVEMSLSNTMRWNNKNLFYANPHELTTVFQYENESLVPIMSIDFGKNKIPPEMWNTPYVEEFEEMLENGSPKSFWPHNLIINDSTLSFWYFHGGYENEYFAICNRNTGDCEVISELTLERGKNRLPAPISIAGDRYISLLYTELLDPNEVSIDEALQKAYHESLPASSPILVFFTMNQMQK